jgi:uncharacterized protein
MISSIIVHTLRATTGLAAKGIITVRIDKRGMFGSAGVVADANAVTIDD